MGTFIITSQMRELREQLSHPKRIGCFFGAGTSMAMGLPGIWDLTTQTINKLDPIDKEKVEGILEHIKTHSFNGTNSTTSLPSSSIKIGNNIRFFPIFIKPSRLVLLKSPLTKASTAT